MKNFISKIQIVFIFLLMFFTSTTIAQTYCAPSFVNGCSTWRNQTIDIGSINWVAPSSCTTWDFTSTSTNVTAGLAETMTVTNANFCGCSVWIDLNADGDFDDVDENLYTMYQPNSSNTYNFSITVPGSASPGMYRMRVIASWGSDGTSVGANGYGGCGAYQYGNYDDFTLNVVGVLPCTAPTGLSATGITTNSANLSWAAGPGAVGYEYVLDTIASTPTGIGTPIQGTSFSTSALLPSKTYYLFVRTDCGTASLTGWSSYSFTTASLPCGIAMSITATSVTANGATISWNPSANAVAYEYVVSTTAAAPSGNGTTILASPYVASGLPPSTLHYAYVRSYCGNGTYSNWNYTFFTTAAPTGIEEEFNFGISANPNPAKDNLTIKLTNQSGSGRIEVVDIYGRSVKYISVNSTELDVDMSDLSNGYYFVKYTDESHARTLRIVKQK